MRGRLRAPGRLVLVALLAASCDGSAERDLARTPAAPASRVAAHRAWTRTADSGAVAAAYLVISNTGAGADTLTGLRSAAAAEASMHVSMNAGGTMRMVPVGALPVRAGDSVVFQPLGTHVMLTGLRQSLSDGDTIPLALDFSSGTTLAVPVVVRRP